MRTTFFNNRSIYLTTSIIIISAVFLVMSASTLITYLNEKRDIDSKIKVNAEEIIDIAEDHIKGMISAYAINEYSKIIRNEVEHYDLLGMLVEDQKMSKLLGQTGYIRGFVRNDQWQIVPFDSDNIKQIQKLNQAYFSFEKNLYDFQQKPLGKIRIYLADRGLHQRLHELMLKNLLTTLAISLLLSITLFVMIRMHLIRPLIEIIENLIHPAKDGLPELLENCQAPKEIKQLNQTINHMISSIKQSHHELIQKSADLKTATDRLQLAVDGTQDGLWDWDIQGHKFYLSERYANMLGYAANELKLTPKKWLAMIHPDEADKVRYNATQYLTQHADSVYEDTFRVQTKQGNWLWITSRGKALFNDHHRAIRFVGFNTDVTESVLQREALQEQKTLIQYQAGHDPLTELTNRNLFFDHLDLAIKKASRSRSKLAILFIDIDNFKEVNDSLGHDAGDQVLKVVAKRLEQIVQANDTLARLGGDEFTLLIEELEQEQNASVQAKKIINDFKNTITIPEHELHLGCSIGISVYPQNGDSANDLLKNADAAMYRAKNKGRNNFQYYSKEMTEEAFNRLNMEANIRTGIQKQQFEVYFQPQINNQKNHITGMEALVRWNHPKEGFIPPARFIDVAAATGAIVELDRYVMQQAINQFEKWNAQGLNPGRLSLNLNLKQLHREDFVPFLKALLEQSLCTASCLELEVTEGELMNDPKEAIQVLKQIEALGIKLSLDDFGTGYSSLSYLKKLPISKLKIDRSFVKDLPDDSEDEAIVRAIIALAQSLNLDILAEGTETIEQVQLLEQLGCDTFQGYYFSKPVSASEMTQLLEKHR